jgi:hypothetical protein
MQLRGVASAILFLPLLAGCGSSGGNHPTPAPVTPDLSGNWQIQAAAAAPPASGILMLGALTSNGANVTGTFQFSDLNQVQACGGLQQVLAFTGSIDAGRNLTLTSAPFAGTSVVKVQLAIPALATSYSAGTIEISGGNCTEPSTAALGSLFAPLTGVYAGSVLPGPSNPATTGGGPATLTLTQSSTPNSTGQFPLSGTLSLTLGSCSLSRALTGNANGIVANLAGFTAGFDDVNLVTAEQPDGAKLPTVTIFFVNPPCPADTSLPTSYTGALTRQ